MALRGGDGLAHGGRDDDATLLSELVLLLGEGVLVLVHSLGHAADARQDEHAEAPREQQRPPRRPDNVRDVAEGVVEPLVLLCEDLAGAQLPQRVDERLRHVARGGDDAPQRRFQGRRRGVCRGDLRVHIRRSRLDGRHRRREVVGLEVGLLRSRVAVRGGEREAEGGVVCGGEGCDRRRDVLVRLGVLEHPEVLDDVRRVDRVARVELRHLVTHELPRDVAGDGGPQIPLVGREGKQAPLDQTRDKILGVLIGFSRLQDVHQLRSVTARHRKDVADVLEQHRGDRHATIQRPYEEHQPQGQHNVRHPPAGLAATVELGIVPEGRGRRAQHQGYDDHDDDIPRGRVAQERDERDDSAVELALEDVCLLGGEDHGVLEVVERLGEVSSGLVDGVVELVERQRHVEAVEVRVRGDRRNGSCDGCKDAMHGRRALAGGGHAGGCVLAGGGRIGVGEQRPLPRPSR
mmetsp:Transcript_37357/g.72983  ORF Transcript_37357/g.72983 Transcript_37357/m.72983 type:complete len:462 (+) Transcript_37357:401-1786(+)